MLVDIGTAKLFVDVEGVGLEAGRQKPTLVLLHGGPGADHTMFKPAFSQLSDIAQIVYFDMRGCGRSSGRDPAEWTLAQWGEDVKTLCDTLGIVRPIVVGLSFGGFVAQAYATQFPRHPGGLVLISTAARMPAGTVFDALVDVQAAEAREIGAGTWESSLQPPATVTIHKIVPDAKTRAAAEANFHRYSVLRPKVSAHFAAGEEGAFDFRKALRKIRCPTLILAGDADGNVPLPLAEELADRIPPARVALHVFHRAGHIVQLDAPKPVFKTLRKFIATLA
jgi:proline iminopeptidase